MHLGGLHLAAHAALHPHTPPSQPLPTLAPTPLPLRSLRQQLQWRYACDPDANACCLPTSPGSVLAHRLGIRGLVPMTEAGCTGLPGCLAQSHCWPSWGLDSCRAFKPSAACLAAEQCQVGSCVHC